MKFNARNSAQCPTPSAHARLNEAHRLWHQASDNYNDSEGFRVNLNACIQALRNVTFVLQKEKSLIPNFDEWYSKWQDKLRNHDILKWLVEARNVIVKEGDLETKSRVRVAVLSNYYDPPAFEVNDDPMISTKDVAAMMSSDIPEHLIANGILRVERKWISIDLPKYELLDALSHSYGVLSTLVLDAHTQLTSKPQAFVRNKDGELVQYEGSIDHLGGRLPCMVVAKDVRTILVKLSTGKYIKADTIKVKKISNKEVIKRYGGLARLIKKTKPRNMRERAYQLLDQAKVIFSTDGYHVPIAIMELPNRKVNIIALKMDDPAERHLTARRLVTEAEKNGARNIFCIGEAWRTSYSEKYTDRPIEEIEERTEVLVVEYLSSDSEEFSLHCTINRTNDCIEFGEVEENHRCNTMFLTPLKEAWKRKKREKIRSLPKYNIGRNALCPCRSGKKFKICCAPHIGTNLMDTANYLYGQQKYAEAEGAYRAFLTQYIIWYNEHTVPFVQHSPREADAILVVDIKAIADILYCIAKCLFHQGKIHEIGLLVDRASDIINDPRYRIEIKTLQEKIKEFREIDGTTKS